MGAQPSYTRFTRPLFEVFARLVFRLYCPLTVIGHDNLPALPYLFCSNHTSHMDSIALMMASGQRFDCFGLLAAEDYFFRRPLVYGWFSCMVHLIPIGRRPTVASLHHTMQACRDFLDVGPRGLILFPEGTRSTNGGIAKFKRGGGMLSASLGIPLVPVYIEGTQTAMPKGRFFPMPHRITVRIGAPVYPETNRAATHGATYDNIVLEARKRIEQMEGAVRGK